MTFDPVRRNYGFPSLTWKEKLYGVNYLQSSIFRARFILSSLVLILIVASCATRRTPHIQPTGTKFISNSKLLGFIQDGITTREEVVLKLGTPSAKFEGEKILTYQLRVDKAENWDLVYPQVSEPFGFRVWREGTYSLVLVFGDDGALQKHSLVEAK